jgi:hypothetical protein
LMLLLLILAASGRAAFAGIPERPSPVTVIVVDHLSLMGLQSTSLENLKYIRDRGAVALISPGLARFPGPLANQWATFTAGDVINTRNEHIGLLDRQLLANGVSSDVVIIHFGDAGGSAGLASLDTLLGEVLKSTPSPTIMVCSITPPQLADGSWDELSPIVVYGPGIQPGSSLTSSTTRTNGLVALRDIAPSLLNRVGAPIPISMTGAPVSICNAPMSDLVRMNRIVRLGQQVIVPLSWLLGLSALAAVAGGAFIFGGGSVVRGKTVCYLLRLVIAAPLALLIVPCLPIFSVAQYVVAMAALDMALALVPSPLVLLALTCATVLVDAITGSHLIATTVVSGYWLSGIRFYGIGNEFMGVLIGMSLMAPALLLSREPKSNMSTAKWGTGFFFAFVIFVLSYPALGAKAGGAVTSVVTFGLAWLAMFSGRRPSWIGFLAASAVGFLLIFALALLARRLNAPPSHIQAAVAAVHQGRLGYIKHIVIRKAKMAVKTIGTPGGVVAFVGLVPLYFFWNRSALRGRVNMYLSSRPQLTGALRAGGWGLVATLLYNDSGGVAFLFFFGAMALVLLHEMVNSACVSSRSTSAMSA